MSKIFEPDFQSQVSMSLKEMIKTGIGCRNVSFRGSESRKLKDILLFETEELGNYSDLESIIWNLFGQEVDLSEDEDDDFKKSKKYIDKIIKELTSYLGSEPYGIWLTTQEGVIENYRFKGEPLTITSYKIPENSFAILDLYTAGALFAIAIKPRDLEIVEEKEVE